MNTSDEERTGLELAIVGTALVHPDQFDALAEIVAPDMIHGLRARVIWDALAERIPAGLPVDYAALHLALPQDHLRKMGGPASFSIVAEHALPDAVWHAEQLRDLAARERLAIRLRGALIRVEQDGDLPAAVEALADAMADAEAATTGNDGGAGSDWDDVDLTPVLEGTHKPLAPAVGARDDGIGLFYPGRVNGIQGESEAGKSWVALIASLTEINRGNHVFYLDFEDSEEGVIGRMRLIGAAPADLRARFHYVRPGTTPTPDRLKGLFRRVADLNTTLVVVDGVTEAMSLLGMELKENSEIARFGRLLLRPLAETGAAVVPLDHVVKSSESRGRYALGGVHKLNAVDGVQYMLEAVRPFGVNTEGRSRLRIAKDRPAQIRKHALPGSNGLLHWFADLVVKSEGDDFAEAHLYPPIQRPNDPAEMSAEEQKAAQEEAEIRDREAKVLEVLRKAAEPLSKTAIEEATPGRASVTRRALTRLVMDGRVVTTDGPRKATLHRLPDADGDTE